MAKVNKMHERLRQRLTSSTGKVIIPTRNNGRGNPIISPRQKSRKW